MLVAVGGRERRWAELASPFPLDELVPGPAPWEVELGFGKGRHLLARALAAPGARFLGVEIAHEYYQVLAGRAARRGAGNLVTIRAEALYLLAAILPRRFAAAVHVYFPDPWPKARQKKRRLFDAETVDLVLGLLKPGGTLYFATDFREYGELVAEILAGYPGFASERVDAWPEGPRTNYEAKYVVEGRPILRLVGRLAAEPEAVALHPAGRLGVVAAWEGGAEEAAPP